MRFERSRCSSCTCCLATVSNIHLQPPRDGMISRGLCLWHRWNGTAWSRLLRTEHWGSAGQPPAHRLTCTQRTTQLHMPFDAPWAWQLQIVHHRTHPKIRFAVTCASLQLRLCVKMTCRKHGWKHQRHYRPARNLPQTASTEGYGRCHDPADPQCVTVAVVMPQLPVHHHLILRVRVGRPASTAKRTSTLSHLRGSGSPGQKPTLTNAPGQAAARAKLDHCQVAIGQLLRPGTNPPERIQHAQDLTFPDKPDQPELPVPIRKLGVSAGLKEN